VAATAAEELIADSFAICVVCAVHGRRWAITDPQVRHRGTFGGALAHADPAGDLGAVALSLDAEFVIVGAGGKRTVPAGEFFIDYFTTALAEDEVLAEVRFPRYTGWKHHCEKFDRTAQAWSVVYGGSRGSRWHYFRGEDRADEHGHHADPSVRCGVGAGRAAGERRRRSSGRRARERGYRGSE